MITGMCFVRGSDFSLRHTSKPCMPGIITSSRITSARSRAQMCNASGPPRAVRTSKYSAVSRASSSFTFASTSSTTSTRAVITCYRAAPMNWRTVSRNMATEMGLEI